MNDSKDREKEPRSTRDLVLLLKNSYSTGFYSGLCAAATGLMVHDRISIHEFTILTDAIEQIVGTNKMKFHWPPYSLEPRLEALDTFLFNMTDS